MEEILKRLIKGDREAFNEIVDYYELKLFSIALTRLKNEHLAREAVQDTFVSVYVNIKKLKKIECFGSWIVKILVNICNQKYRKRIFSEVSYEDINAESILKKDGGIQRVLDDISFLEILNPLSDDDRTLMFLYYKYEYTTREIADILRINENTVRTRIRRARETIKKEMDGDKCE